MFDETAWRRNLWVCTAGAFTTIVAMTLLIPFLPVYVRELGVTNSGAVLRWSGIAYGATFLTAALTAPLWGALGDRYGRKLMLIRASLGMSIAMSLIGLSQNVWELVALRLLVGLLGGYASGATILVAAQTPKDRSAWALGVVSSGIMAGNIAGPLLGGVLPHSIGPRETFLLTGGLVFLTFLATTFLLKEDRSPEGRSAKRSPAAPAGTVPSGRNRIVVLLVTGSLLTFATMSVEPLITEYVTSLNGPANATIWAGVIMSVGAFGSVLAAPRVGRLADRVGHRRVIIACLCAAAVCLAAQALANGIVVLAVTRLAMGLSLGGLAPAITASLRHGATMARVGQILGYNVSAQYAGQVLGPTAGGFLAAATGLRSVFYATALILLVVAAANIATSRQPPAPDASANSNANAETEKTTAVA